VKNRYVKVIAVCLATVLLASVFSMPVAAADMRSGDTVTIGKAEVIEGDLYVAGNSIVIEGTVNGDVFAAGRSIVISGTVKGGVTAAAQTVSVTGAVGAGVRIAGQTLTVAGQVGRDVVAAGSDLVTSASVGGDIFAGVSTAMIDGQVTGNVKGGGSTITIGARVGRNVEVEAETLTLRPTAAIQGDLIYTSGKQAALEPGAKVSGATTRRLPESAGQSVVPQIVSAIQGKFIAFLMIFVIGLIGILVAARKLDAMGDALRTGIGRSAGWGALVLFATPVAAVIVMFTLIGLPAGLIALALWGMVVYLAQIPVGLLVGKLVLRRPLWSKKSLVGALALGLFLLTAVSAIPVLGFWIGLATVMFGLGSVVVMVMRSRVDSRSAYRQ
jgi:cytoskeletal protein CcmA (bactofilin family)